MRQEDVRALLRAEPFHPLRFRLKDGRTYDVIHQNLTLSSGPWLVIGFPDPDSNGRWAEDSVDIQWDEIESVEPLVTEEART